MPEKSV